VFGDFADLVKNEAHWNQQSFRVSFGPQLNVTIHPAVRRSSF
jgi:hypothetical protein